MRAAGEAAAAAPRADLAKLSLPRLYEVLPRQRLFRLLDELSVRPVLWVCGPPGAGKTALLASWIQQRARPHLWYQADADDGDPANLFHFLSIAIRRFAPALDLPPLSPEYRADLPRFARRFWREFYAALPAGALLVVDNLHEAATASTLAVLRVACTEIPAGVGLAILSRDEAAPELAALLAARTMSTLSWEELRFRPGEVACLAPADGGWSGSALERLCQRADGWAAGLVLLLERARTVAGSDPFAAESEPVPRDALFAYFASEIFAACREEVRALLLATAFLPAFTAAQAVALSGLADAEALLDGLYRSRYFVDLRAAPLRQFHYHALFRAFLLDQEARLVDAAARRERRRAAAELMLADGRDEDAIELYLAASAWDEAAALIAGRADASLRSGRGAALAAWIRALPADLVERSPWLEYWLGMVLLAQHPAAARTRFELAHGGFAEQGDDVGRLCAAAAVVETYFFEWSNFTPLDRWIDELARLAGTARAAGAEHALRILSAALVAMLYRQPAHPLFADLAATVFGILRDAPDAAADTQMTAATFLLNALSWIGDFDSARQVVAMIEGRLPAASVAPLRRCWWLLRRAYFEYLDARHDAALATLEAARAIAAERGFAAVMRVAHLYEVFVRLSCGELEAAAQLCERLETLIDPARRLDVALHRYQKAWLALARGDPAALRHARTAATLAEEAGVPNIAGYFLIAQGLAESRAGVAAAATTFAGGYGRTLCARYPQFDFAAQLILAQIEQRLGRPAEADAALRRAVAIGAAHEFHNCLLWLAPAVAELCARALRLGLAPAYLRRLIAARGLSPPPGADQHWPWPLRIRCLGDFVVERDGVPLRFAGKVQRRPLELLQALVGLGGRDVDAQRLADLLWPEAEGDAAQKALEMALLRLRRLLDVPGAILLRDGRLSLDRSLCWDDVAAFEALCDGVEAAAAHPGAAAALLDLYGGSFLAAAPEGASWPFEPRRRLRGRLLRALRHCLADSASAGGDREALLRRALRADPLIEDLHASLVTDLLEQGRRDEAAAAFRQGLAELSKSGEVRPSPHFLALARRIESS